MAHDGLWVLNDDYEFELQEPYASMLMEVKLAATKAWRDTILDYLEPRTPYTREELDDGLMHRNDRKNEHPTDRVNGFILDALIGDL